MVNPSDIFKTATSLLSDIPSTSVLRERVVFLKDQIMVLNERVMNLEKENSSLKEKLRESLEKLSESTVPLDEFVEKDGRLFKKRNQKDIKSCGPESSGVLYHRAVYCPTCHKPASYIDEGDGYVCLPCLWFSKIKTEFELNRIIDSLER